MDLNEKLWRNSLRYFSFCSFFRAPSFAVSWMTIYLELEVRPLLLSISPCTSSSFHSSFHHMVQSFIHLQKFRSLTLCFQPIIFSRSNPEVTFREYKIFYSALFPLLSTHLSTVFKWLWISGYEFHSVWNVVWTDREGKWEGSIVVHTIKLVQDGDWHDDDGNKEISNGQWEEEEIGCIL